MAKLIDGRIQDAQAAFAANVLVMLEGRQMKRVKLARQIEADGGPVSKTVYNMLAGKHPPNLENWAAVAKALDAPLWLLLVPGLHKRKELLTKDSVKQLAALLENYILCSTEMREQVRDAAKHGANLARRGKDEPS